jgi:hypothetical protein
VRPRLEIIPDLLPAVEIVAGELDRMTVAPAVLTVEDRDALVERLQELMGPGVVVRPVDLPRIELRGLGWDSVIRRAP